MRIKDDSHDKPIGFQIAPMIDVVFVIMLFFMVMAGAVKIENELNIKLPGTAESDDVNFVDEIIVEIDKPGQITLNDEPMDTPTSRDLLQLKGTLIRLKQNSDAAKNQVIVTIICGEEARFGRAIDVLDALAYAKITNVTFSVDEGLE